MRHPQHYVPNPRSKQKQDGRIKSHSTRKEKSIPNLQCANRSPELGYCIFTHDKQDLRKRPPRAEIPIHHPRDSMFMFAVAYELRLLAAEERDLDIVGCGFETPVNEGDVEDNSFPVVGGIG